MTDLQAIHESREHWKRMIEQAKKFIISGEQCHIYMMKNILGETWSARNCPLCIKHNNPYNSYDTDCELCPLFLIEEVCRNSKSAWFKIDNSLSWPEWKHNAETYMLPALDRAEKFCRDRGDTE